MNLFGNWIDNVVLWVWLLAALAYLAYRAGWKRQQIMVWEWFTGGVAIRMMQAAIVGWCVAILSIPVLVGLHYTIAFFRS